MAAKKTLVAMPLVVRDIRDRLKSVDKDVRALNIMFDRLLLQGNARTRKAIARWLKGLE